MKAKENINKSLSAELLAHLKRQGVREVVICPGSYNSPLIARLEDQKHIQLHYHYDERGASFFALGRIKQLLAPVAVCVTSGTAVAECLPAVIEAKYTGLPLVIISGDRPQRYVGSGAPQVIEQLEVLSAFVLQQCDIVESSGLPPLPTHGPSHFNIRFEEPLFDSASKRPSGATVCPSLHNRPLVILGEIPAYAHASVAEFIEMLQAPVYAEPLSGLREAASVQKYVLHSGELGLRALGVDSVVRIGGVPVTSYWRDLERDADLRGVAVQCFSDLPYTGLARVLQTSPLSEIGSALRLRSPDSSFIDFARELDASIVQEVDLLLQHYPHSEQALIRQLSEAISLGSQIYLGNSLPIREWMEYATYSERGYTYAANRGVNGIDGQIASFAGFSKAKCETWAILGDLTFLYDLSSLTLLERAPTPLRLVVISNGGGQIFRSLPYFASEFSGERGERFLNPHVVDVPSLARALGICFCAGEDFLDGAALPDRVIIELSPQPDQSDAVSKALSLSGRAVAQTLQQ